MDELLKKILFQAAMYASVFLMSIFGMALVFRGFFFPYLRVRASFGRLVLINCRAINRNFFRVGKVDEGTLKFKKHKKEATFTIPEGINPFYRSLGVTWVNFDDETNALILPDMTAIEGYDGEKYSELIDRALFKPSITDNKTKIIMICQIVSMFLLIAIVIMIINNGKQYTLIKSQLATIGEQIKFLIPKNVVA